uniref:PDZ domain-containing protein n=1 Tax=Zooxanthella nutricula TaxID=1333877 RepID=A0A7S2NRR5_9DINO
MFCCCATEAQQVEAVAVQKVALWETPTEAEAQVTVEAEPAIVDAPEDEAPVVPADPPKVEQRQAPQSFDAVLERPASGLPFGWALDMLHPDALHVESLTGDANAAVTTYNASAPGGFDIRAGDYITRVNGSAGSAKNLGDLLVKSQPAQVSIQRPATYVIEIAKGDRPLGVDLNYTTKGSSVYITNVRDGVISEQAPGVRKGHRIVSVGGKALPPKEMVDALRSSKMKIEFLAPPEI